jgi:outer membrane protein assembly complex protein YaeT
MGLLVLAAAGAGVSLAQAPAGKVIVADVIPIGNQNVPTQRIIGMLKTLPGKEYSEAVAQEDVARLAKLRLFRDIKVREEMTTDGRVIVYFQLTEYPNLVTDVIYRHPGHLKPEELDGLTGVKKGEPLNPSRNKQGCLAIEQRLKESGRLWAKVHLEEGANPGDTRVVYNICEGPVVRVRSTSFTGNATLATQARLRTQIDSSRAFLGLPVGGTYNPAMVDHDAIKVAEYYKANGYLDVRVTRELAFSDDCRWVDVTYHISEGQKYRVKDVTVEPMAGSELRYLPRDQIKSIIKLHAGDNYNESVVEGDIKNITDLYGWRGYGVVAHKELYYPEQGVVQVRYEIQEKPPAKVGEIIIIGNAVTKDRVIRRLIPLYPGQTLSYPLLRQAEADLARSNLFETDPEKGGRPTVTVLEDGSDSEFKNILVQVPETHTGSLLFGIGVNSDAGLVGSIVLNERNFDLFRPPTSLADILEGRAFRGGGQEFRIEAVPGTQLQRYTISFREPFLFDRPYSLGTSAYYYDRSFNEDTETREGGRITIGHQFNRYWSASVSARIENVHIGNVLPWAPPDYLLVQGNNFLFAPSARVTYDSRDSFLKPTKGELVEGSVEYVTGDFNFPVLNLEANKYFTVWQRPDGSGKHVLAARSQISWAGSDAPVFERFYAGGFRSMRGFEFRGMGPFVNGFAVGGDFMFLNSLEYQVPIRANDQIYVVAFLDTGTVERTVEIRDYRVSAGVGLRLVVPMLGPVPIALDFGFPIVKGPQDREQIFSFWVGLFR